MESNSVYCIHETAVRDIVELLVGAKNDIKKEKIYGMLNRSKSFKSASSATSNLVLTFPVLTSKMIPIDTASMISKAVERRSTVLMQMLFSAVALDNADNAIDFVRQYHTNLDVEDLTIDGFMDAVDKYVVNASADIVDKEAYEAIKEDMKNINYVMPETISEYSLNNYKVKNNVYDSSVTVMKEGIKDVKFASKEDTDDTYTNSQVGYDSASKGSHPKDAYDINSKRILDSDVKKANELVPTTMIIDFISTSNDKPVKLGNIIIGIKAKLYYIDSEDIMNRIIVKNNDRNGLLNFIRATTRETSFWKDFIFAVDHAKLDAVSTSNGKSSKLWKVLERRSTKSRINRTVGHSNTASAISTLVVNKDEVEYLKKTQNIDVENPMIIRPIMEAYNLMTFCIVDDAMEIAKFIYDTGDDVYESFSYSQLERESNDNTYKKVVNLMTKVAR